MCWKSTLLPHMGVICVKFNMHNMSNHWTYYANMHAQHTNVHDGAYRMLYCVCMLACCVCIYMSCWDFVHAVSMLCLYDILRMHDGIMCMDVGILQLYADIGNVYRHDILCLHDGISTLACCAWTFVCCAWTLVCCAWIEILCMKIGINIGMLCMSIGMLCMNIGMLCMNIGMLCMHDSILCMHVGKSLQWML